MRQTLQQNPTYSKRHPSLLTAIAIVCLLFVAVCYGAIRLIFPPETRAPKAFPDSEIVFVAPGELGFVNADGSHLEYVRLVVHVYKNSLTQPQPWRPVITGDHQALLVKMADPLFYVYEPYDLALWRTSGLPVLCTQWGYQQMAYLSADQQDIFIQTKQGLARYKLSSCGTEEAPLETYENVFGVPSPDLNYVAYTSRADELNRRITLRNLKDGEERIVGEGDYPVWSRDGQQLAYTGPDGIYVYSLEEAAQPRRVIFYPNLFEEQYPTYYGGQPWSIPPEVSWSPDGKWLVYHKWTGIHRDDTADPSSKSIYKLNIETGEEIKILDGGMYPYWRWPAEQP